MLRYNWNKDWWLDGMSLLCFAHHFCRANMMRTIQFRRYFGPKKVGDQDTNQLLQADLSPLDTNDMLRGVGVSTKRSNFLFPSGYAVSGRSDELLDHFVHCPECLEKGLHLSVHQLSWLDSCPIHNEPLHFVCECRATTRFTLVERSKTPGAVCKCGRLKFGAFSKLTADEAERLEEFYSVISRIKRKFRFGITQLRLSFDHLSPDEIRTQLDGISQLLFAISANKLTSVRSRSLRTCSLDLTRTNVNDAVRDRFTRFREFTSSDAYSNRRLQSMGIVASILRDEFFNEHRRKQMALALAANGDNRNVRDCDVDAAIHIFSVRLLEGLSQYRAPVRRHLNPDLKMALRMHGQPLCLITWANKSRTKGRAYWLDDSIDPELLPESWIQKLARSYLLSVFNDGPDQSKATSLYYKVMANAEP